MIPPSSDGNGVSQRRRKIALTARIVAPGDGQAVGAKSQAVPPAGGYGDKVGQIGREETWEKVSSPNPSKGVTVRVALELRAEPKALLTRTE